MIPEPIINQIVTNFYRLAQQDILIGYHFRVIDDFDHHIPRIIQFWNLQLNGTISDRSHLPFKFLELHKALSPNKGEIFRWVKLFESVLDDALKTKDITSDQRALWKAKVDLFASKLDQHLFGGDGI